MKEKLYNELGINGIVLEYVKRAEEKIKERFEAIEDIASYNQLKVLNAMQKKNLSSMHFNWHTGYGYDDPGREKIEEIYAEVFKAEDAIVRPTIVNGTHALTLCLTGLLKPNNEMVAISGKPYDTLDEVIGISNTYNQSLKSIGVKYKQVDLLNDGSFDVDKIMATISDQTTMVYIQRSSGYSWRRSLTIIDLETMIKEIKAVYPNIIVMIDNCYGEFLDFREPIEVGADILAGSLIKNPGGGLALTGGYIVGKESLIEQVSYRMTSPGIGKECGLMFGQARSMLHGLFIAPQTVAGAVKGALLCSEVFSSLGYQVNPKVEDPRSDIIQSIKLGTSEKVIAFCEAIQASAPVDAHVTPIPWAMPGYDSEVIMAAGAFVQGSSIELSADAPIREPYIVYFQGGITYDHSKFGVMKALKRIMDIG